MSSLAANVTTAGSPRKVAIMFRGVLRAGKDLHNEFVACVTIV
jgi:hypothetical protein